MTCRRRQQAPAPASAGPSSSSQVTILPPTACFWQQQADDASRLRVHSNVYIALLNLAATQELSETHSSAIRRADTRHVRPSRRHVFSTGL